MQQSAITTATALSLLNVACVMLFWILGALKVILICNTCDSRKIVPIRVFTEPFMCGV